MFPRFMGTARTMMDETTVLATNISRSFNSKTEYQKGSEGYIPVNWILVEFLGKPKKKSKTFNSQTASLSSVMSGEVPVLQLIGKNLK
jgi:hypothetical protein